MVSFTGKVRSNRRSAPGVPISQFRATPPGCSSFPGRGKGSQAGRGLRFFGKLLEIGLGGCTKGESQRSHVKTDWRTKYPGLRMNPETMLRTVQAWAEKRGEVGAQEVDLFAHWVLMLAAALIERGKYDWSQRIPTDPGVYWARHRLGRTVQLVELRLGATRLLAWEAGQTFGAGLHTYDLWLPVEAPAPIPEGL